jgi:hypothetical protein
LSSEIKTNITYLKNASRLKEFGKYTSVIAECPVLYCMQVQKEKDKYHALFSGPDTWSEQTLLLY